MPGLAQRNEQLNSNNNGFWSKQRDDISYNQLQKFWSELPLQARQKLLRIDKQTLFEQARKNMYCSRCNGLLLEGFLQIVMYGKTLQQEEGGKDLSYSRLCASKFQVDGGQNAIKGCHDEIQDPSVHPWGGLTTTRDGSLTLLGCYLCSKSLKGLQIVFDSARARERERELLYPDACGGGGRGWTGPGMASYGRGHGTRETCALHTARLSCDTLVDFWSALGEETRQSLLRMKEEDFIERLMYRFDSKRFCRDCRRNVIREYKELKELKRLRRETRCTSWFCAADTAFQYEVSDDTIQADWHQIFADMVGTYHHFEWAVGTGEGKSDILDFENVGLTGSVRVNGLDLVDLSACYITLRAWKLDGRCSEICVKAHALKGQQCVHCRLIVGDGFVSITRGESIRRLFEHAEEAEEEEDDDSVDKDGSDLDGECSRPQKHAKSPELAREFLLDAATVIFKEQVEKAFREGTARQNAHSIFVCLALKLLEERVHVACKEIITLEKQMKLLEEEEKEKREEEERKERRRIKEREKKLRRKERLKGKDKDKEKKCPESNDIPEISKDEMSHIVDNNSNDPLGRDSVDEPADISLSVDGSPDIQDHTFSNGHALSVSQDEFFDNVDGLVMDVKDGTNTFVFEESKFSRQKQKVRKDAQFANTLEGRVLINQSNSRCQSDDSDTRSGDINGSNRQPRTNVSKSNARNGGLKFNEKFNPLNYRINDKHDLHSCSCHQNGEYRAKGESRVNAERVGYESKLVNKAEFAQDTSKQSYWGHKYTQVDYTRESCGRSKGRCITGNSSFRDFHNLKKVWEPIESQKKHVRSSSETDATLRISSSEVEGVEADGKLCKSSDNATRTSRTVYYEENKMNDARKPGALRLEYEDVDVDVKDPCFSAEVTSEEAISCPIKSSELSGTSDPNTANTSNSDNSSCFSEGDSNGFSSNHGSVESSSTSDSEDAGPKLEERKTTNCVGDAFLDSHGIGVENKQPPNKREAFKDEKAFGYPLDVPMANFLPNPQPTISQNPENGIPTVNVDIPHQSMFPPMHNQGLHYPVIQDPSTIGYYHQNSLSWHPAAANGFLPFPQPNQFFYAGDFGYGLNGSSPMYMHYNPMQQWSTPMYNPTPLPVYQPAAKVNVFQPEENIQSNKVKETLAKVGPEMACPTGTSPLEAAPRKDAVPTNIAAKKQAGDNNGFSLFQFDGPLALSKECKPLPSENGNKEGFSSEVSADKVDEGACNKKEIVMEEYNLFAASNGIKFSLF